ncbi:MAG TPA: DMT family transporter [Hyphomicrobiaceae bacterium]|nr:DMT family transporter [Hyphomicrobiaceae bacterium]
MQPARPGASEAAAPAGERRVAPVRQDSLRGILLVCVAFALFSGLDATAKYMATVVQLPVTQVTWIRFVSQFLLIVLVMGIVQVPRLLSTVKLKQQLVRSVLMMASTVMNFLALRHLRLDQTQTIYFLAPFVVALLAGPFLGEWVGWRRLVAIMVGFSGIIVVVRPGVATFEPAMLFAFGSMLAYASFMLLTRYLASYDPPEVTLFYSLLAGTYFLAPLAIVDWVWPESVFIWLLLGSMGLWGGLGHYIFILAYRRAPASTLAPFVYLGLVTHVAAGYLVFNQVPDAWTLAGAGIVIASGIYLVHREHVTRRAKARSERADT